VTSPRRAGLGRVFDGHDERNLREENLARPLLARRELRDIDRYWPMPSYLTRPLDQGNTPECTGFGSAHELALGPIQVAGITADYAHDRYLRNVATDNAAGRFFSGGGATVAATMRAAKADRLITGYVWNRGLTDTVDALTNIGPVCLGTTWRDGMFDPSPEGLLRCVGDDAGGHFYVLAARVRNHPQFGRGCWMVQSWGKWGVGVPQLGLSTGCAFIRDGDLENLLKQTGESVIMRDFFLVPPTPPAAPYFAANRSRVFHGFHPRIRRDREFATYAEALGAGLRPCASCRPGSD
jgi:hypothetical protein